MTENPLLSFCIPTYNQPEKVAALLAALQNEITPEAEILIRDDSSDNHTEEAVNCNPLRERIRYFHGKKEGYDAAALFLLEEAKGKYAWIFGDDILRPGAFRKVQATLTGKPDITFLFINSANVNQPDVPGLNFGQDFYFKDRNQVLTALGDILAFPSGAIFLRSAALQNKAGLVEHKGLAVMSFSLALHVLSEDGRAFFLNEPLILTDPKLPDQKIWYDVFQVYGINIFRVLESMRDRFSSRAIRVAERKNLNSVLRGILVARARGLTANLGGPSVRTWKMFRLYWKFPEMWLALPVLILPRGIVRFLYFFYKWLFPRTIQRFSGKLE